jgi:hypothetical protein
MRRQGRLDKYIPFLSNKGAFEAHQVNCHRAKKYMASAGSADLAAQFLRNAHRCRTENPPDHIEAESERLNALSIQPTKDAYKPRKDKHLACGAQRKAETREVNRR